VTNTTPLLDDAPWSPSLALRVEGICNRFEAACKAGQRPQIAHFLGQTQEPERLVLLRELLAVEVEYRRKRGEEVTPEEYGLQFSRYANLIGDLLTPPPVPPPCHPRCALEAPLGATAEGSRASPAGDQPPAIAGYEVLEELGRGGMGIVYRARQVRLKRVVALKMILGGPQPTEHQQVRFRVEAEAIARLQHPNIVQIFEVGEVDHLPYLALELVAGGGLDRRLAGTPQEPRAAAGLLETVARAIHYAHEQGVVHRDLKPANVLLASPVASAPDGADTNEAGAIGLADWIPKITDFGLAKQMDGDAGATQSGAVVGTPSYMAPEQASGRIKEVGPAADVYALGVILYETLTGQPPFKGTTPLATLAQVISQDPVAPRRLQPAVPRDLETICLKCLAKEPQQRYASAEALALDLRRFLDGEPIHARATPPLVRARRWMRRRPALAALLLFLALSPLALLALLLWHDRDLAVKLDHALTSAALSQLKADGEESLRKAQEARASGNLQGAKIHLDAAVKKTGSDPSLQGLQAEAQRQREEVQILLDRQAGRSRARARYEELCKKRDRALFYESQFTGLTPAANAQATRAAARQALALFAARSDSSVPANDDPAVDLGPRDWFSAAERADITAGCYELLLILARATAQPLEGEDVGRQTGAALRLLDRAAQLRRPTRALHLCRAACLAQQKDTSGAARETARAAALEPADALDHFLLGAEHAHRKELPQAVAHFKDALRVQPDSFWAHYYLAVYSLALQRPDQAETSLTVCQSLGKDRDFVWVYILRGYANGQLGERALRKEKDSPGAVKSGQAALHFAAAAADFRQAQSLLQGQPDRGAAYTLHVNRAATLMLQAKHAEALKDLQEAVRLQPEHFHAYLLLAEACTEQKDHRMALAQLDRAIRLQPDLALLYHKRGQVQRARGNLRSALDDFTKAAGLLAGGRLSSTEALVLANAHAERGEILYSQKNYPEALQAFDDARKVRPDWPKLHLLRGGVLQELAALGRRGYEDARQAYDDYLQQERQPAARVYEARALVRSKLQDYAGAVADYSRALEIEPGSASRHAYRGWTYLVSGAPRLAWQDFDRAVALDAGKGDPRVGRGYALVQLGHPHKGIRDVEEGLRLGPTSSRLLYNAAQAYAKAVSKLGAGPGPRDHAAMQKRLAYQGEAVDLLSKALLLLPAPQRASFWRDCIQGNAALSPILDSPGFARLASTYARAK
jgi:serine/threonine protein kinase/tetratricopeptide (TPR) repeat protein